VSTTTNPEGTPSSGTVGKGSSVTSWRVPGLHWEIGGAFLLAVRSLLIGVVLRFIYRAVSSPFFRGKVLNRDTLTLCPTTSARRSGMFGIDPNEPPAPG
jgi:hypothetical protein